MSSPAANPFLDPAVTRGLYRCADRLAGRTSALHRARITGRHAAHVITDLAADASLPDSPIIADLGCGRGTTTAALARRFPAAVVVAVDASAALLSTALTRVTHNRARMRAVCADFHDLPLRPGLYHLVVAAFCLYHSPSPSNVIRQIARCLAPGGIAILATKSADSYRELDELMAACGLDPQATSRPSLYETAHSANLARLARRDLNILHVVHERHSFQFGDLGHLAEYLITNPKYELVESAKYDPATLAAMLRERLPDRPVRTSSTLTYLVARETTSA